MPTVPTGPHVLTNDATPYTEDGYQILTRSAVIALDANCGTYEQLWLYAAERGWPVDAAGFAKHVRNKLVREAEELDTQVSLMRSVRLDPKHRRPVLPRISRIDLAVSAK